MASARRKPQAPVDDQVVALELAALRQRLVVEGALKLSGIKPKALRDRLVAALVEEGFEASATWIRRPLKEQLEQALAHGALLARKVLSAHVRGATPAELQRALNDAERSGRLKRVLRGKVEAVTGGPAAVLSKSELVRLKASLSVLDKALGQAIRKQGLTLLTSDVQHALDEAAQVVRKGSGVDAAPAGSNSGKGDLALRAVLDALGAVKDEGTGLSYVPDAVRKLLPALPAAVARDMLLLAARRELLELRPEGGLGRLTPEELELCPPGPAGTRLSWARLLEGGQG